MAHLSLGGRLQRLHGVRILVVRSLPVGRSAGPHFTRARICAVIILLSNLLAVKMSVY